MYLELLYGLEMNKLSRVSWKVCFPHKSSTYLHIVIQAFCMYPAEGSSFALGSILRARWFARFFEKQSNIDKQDV